MRIIAKYPSDTPTRLIREPSSSCFANRYGFEPVRAAMLAGKAGIVEVQAYVDGEAISLLLDTEPSPKEEQKVDSVAGWERIDITDLQVGDVFRDGMGIYFNVQVCVWLGPHTNYHSYVVPYPGEDDEPHLYSSGGGIVVEGYHVWRCTTPPASLVETAFEAYEGR